MRHTLVLVEGPFGGHQGEFILPGEAAQLVGGWLVNVGSADPARSGETGLAVPADIAPVEVQVRTVELYPLCRFLRDGG